MIHLLVNETARREWCLKHGQEYHPHQPQQPHDPPPSYSQQQAESHQYGYHVNNGFNNV